jgi:hypothetical protein
MSEGKKELSSSAKASSEEGPGAEVKGRPREEDMGGPRMQRRKDLLEKT